MEQLCKKCILPENYSGVTFNEKGVCNLCSDYVSRHYLGEEQLKIDISKILESSKSNEYDCVIGLSGGRDSTYLLWYAVTKLKLKPLAVFVDSKLIPPETLSNIKKTTEILSVDLIVKHNNFLKRVVRHNLKSWLNYPTPATLVNLCVGCRFGILKYVNEEAIHRNVPIVFAGMTPFERGSFKTDLIRSKDKGKFGLIKGYGKQVIKNPSLISNLYSLKIQTYEYLAMYQGLLSEKRKLKYNLIEPFQYYFRWEEKKIEETIKNELGWERHPGLESSYRGDCEVGIIRQYLYDKMLGYNDKDDNLSWLIRDQQVSREEALERITKEKKTKFEVLESSFKSVGMDFTDYIKRLETNAQKHNIPYQIWQEEQLVETA